MKITKQWLEDRDACEEGLKYWEDVNLPDSTDFIKYCIETNEKEKLQWANWLMARTLKTKKKRVQYTVYAAELVLYVFEKKYPQDNRPRKAIQAAKDYLKTPSKKTKKNASYAAADAADASYDTIDAADANAADAASYAALSASCASYAADAASYAADAVYSAADAAADAYSETLIKILEYGLTL